MSRRGLIGCPDVPLGLIFDTLSGSVARTHFLKQWLIVRNIGQA